MITPLRLLVSSRSIAAPMVIPTRLPSKTPSLEEPQGKKQVVLNLSVTLGLQVVPTQVPSTSEAPRLNPFKATRAQMVIPIRIPSESPPSEELLSKPPVTLESQVSSTQVLTIYEYTRLSPFTSTKVPTAAKREHPWPPTFIDVVPDAKRFDVATKADDTDVPEHLWDLRALKVKRAPTTQEGKALTLLRGVLLRRWRNITNRSLLNFLDLKPTNHVVAKQADGHYAWLNSRIKAYCTCWHGSPWASNQDAEIGRVRVQRISDCSWWNWDGGSTPFFWRWPSEFRTHMRYGTPLWFGPTLAPPYRRPQRAERNSTLKAWFKEKLDKVLKRRYFEVGVVKLFTTFFGVPKGEDNIRVVYDGSLPGLNPSLWCPWFVLPNTNSHLRTVERGTFMSDVDIADFFLNFFLDWIGS
jgi:hypothetical protein